MSSMIGQDPNRRVVEDIQRSIESIRNMIYQDPGKRAGKVRRSMTCMRMYNEYDQPSSRRYSRKNEKVGE